MERGGGVSPYIDNHPFCHQSARSIERSPKHAGVNAHESEQGGRSCDAKMEGRTIGSPPCAW